MKHIWKQDAKCTACKGTGVYVGMAEGGSAGVQCYRCNGTGKVQMEIEWEDFDGRIKRGDISKVFEVNPGIGVDARIQGGMNYDDWFANKPFPPQSEMRLHTCPAWWYQSADYDRKPKWENCICLGSFSSCEHFPHKDECWKRWDIENMEHE